MYIIINMKTKKFAVISIFAGLIIVLQILATYINFGGFPITLTLIPIIIAGAIYGPVIGALMGLVFGIIVSVMVVIGADAAGMIMFVAHPFITITTCLLKGTIAGLLGSLVYKTIRNNKLGIILSAIVTPFTNTLILYITLILFFDTSFTAMISAFVSINFIVELLINVLVAPGLLGLIKRIKSRQQYD